MKKLYICVGLPKCGTTALFNLLEKHELFKCVRHENGSEEARTFLSEEFNLFQENSNKLYFEKFPGYIFNKAILKKIYDYYPESIIILCLRNPIQFLESWYSHQIKRKEYFGNFNEWLFRPISKDFETALDLTRFDKLVQNILEYFPLEQLKIGIMEDWTRLKSLNEICQYFGLPLSKTDVEFINKQSEHVLILDEFCKKNIMSYCANHLNILKSPFYSHNITI